MKSKAILVALAAAAVVWLLPPSPPSVPPGEVGAEGGRVVAGPAVGSNATPRTEESPGARRGGGAGSGGYGRVEPALEKREILAEIEDAAVSYDPAELPRIRPYLEHADGEIRAAAMDGMVVLGDAAAVPMLRDAAARLASRQEAEKFRQAAAFLELPPLPQRR
jgi:hypothetical protein